MQLYTLLSLSFLVVLVCGTTTQADTSSNCKTLEVQNNLQIGQLLVHRTKCGGEANTDFMNAETHSSFSVEHGTDVTIDIWDPIFGGHHNAFPKTKIGEGLTLTCPASSFNNASCKPNPTHKIIDEKRLYKTH